MSARSTEGRGRAEIAGGRSWLHSKKSKARCQVKGCRRPLYLGGCCGYHALRLSGIKAAGSKPPHYVAGRSGLRAPDAP